MRTPKVTQKTDLPNMILLSGDYISGGTVLGFNFKPFPQISFDVTQHDPAYDYVAAAGFVNFPLMYREGKTGYPVFHNTFWNEDIETAGWSEGSITYVTLTGYDSSKTDTENAPYVAAHYENRPQVYCTGLSTISDQNSKCTNFEEFEVTFDYKVDNFNSNDPSVSWGYCFLYHQGSSPTEYQNSIFYIAQITGGTVIFCGKVPFDSGIDATDGTTSNNNLYISDILTTDWTEWQNIKIVTRYDTVNSVYAVYLYVNDTFVPLHAGNPDWNRTDGGLYTYYALSNRFNNFCTRNAYHTGGYWLKNFRIANIFPNHAYRWQTRPDDPSAITTENTFELPYYTANSIYKTCESKISLKTESQECFMLHGYYKILPENVLNASVTYGNNSLVLVWDTTAPYCEKTIATTESEFEITDNSYAYYGNTEIPFMWYPLESDLTTVYKQQGGISYSTWLQVSINNPVFSNGWCIISPDQVTSIDRLSISSGYQNIGFEFFIRITEADTDNMTGTVPVMCLFKTYDSGGYFPGTARTFNLCFIPGIDNDHGILGYWAIVSDNNTVMIKFPYFKNRSISHIAATYATTGSYASVFRSINVFINGSLVFRINYKNDNKIMNQVNSAFGRMFTYGSATGFSGAIRGLRVYAGAGYLNYVNENRAFFRNEDSINFMDTFSDVQLGLSSYWNRVEEVIADQYFDPFTLYPDFRYPETIVYAMPVIKWRNETTGEDVDPSFSIARSSVISGSLSYDDPFGNNGIYIPDTAKITLNVVLQVPPTAVITTDSLTVYKGTYIILDGSGSYDDITAYSWNTGAETAQISVQIMETTTFTLTVTNAYGTDSATITIICKEVPEIIKKADIVPVVVTGQEIPLSPIPYQEVAILLNGQNCFISVRQLGIFLYCSLRVEGRQIFSNVICSINTRVNVFRSPYFTGILRFYDTQGTEKPHYSGLGSRWILVYRAETLPGEFE